MKLDFIDFRRKQILTGWSCLLLGSRKVTWAIKVVKLKEVPVVPEIVFFCLLCSFWRKQRRGTTSHNSWKPADLSPMGKVKVSVAQFCPTLCDRMDCSPLGILQARILEWVAIPVSRGSSQPRDWTQFSCIQADSLPAELPGKSKNTGMGSLSLLQGIFLTQELNQGLLHCRQILSQLSYQGSAWGRWTPDRWG